MSSSTICSVFLGLILISQYPFIANGRSHRLLHESLIGIVCSESSNVQECNNILESNPHAAQVKNFRELTKVVLEMAICKASEGQTFLKGLAASTNCPALTGCATYCYNNVVASLKSSLGQFDEDLLSANYDAKISIDGLHECDREMATAHVINPQVTALNRQVAFYSQLAFIVTQNHFL